MSIKRILGVYENKVCRNLGCFRRIILQATGTVMSHNPEHISHIAHKASHRCEKTSTLTPFCTHFNPLQSSNVTFYT